MPSTVAWIDYDSEANQRAQRILTLFREKDTRDELGFGPIRDAISDTLFPGTSVIHTRLRYMLFLPWIYQDLESRGIRSLRIAERARAAQLYLGDALLNNAADQYGIIGRDVKEGLKTLPASIYWAGLGSWGLRTYPGTVGQYHRALDNIYARRRRSSSRRSAATDEGDDLGGLWENGNHTWHPGIPNAPEDFPDCANFDLTRDEVHYLQERIRHTHPDSLLTLLMFNSRHVSVENPWEHPDIADFRKEQQDLLYHGHNFSLVAFGAAILYNIMLAEITGRDDLLEEHLNRRRHWIERLDARLGDIAQWGSNLPGFWALVDNRGHQIGMRTKAFVERWVELLLAHHESVFAQEAARDLVRRREIEKKGGNSRFTNERMQDQWGGSSGLTPMTYRWNIVQGYTNDMAKAMGR